MGRWRKVINHLLTDLATEIPSVANFRVNIDQKIWGAEQIVSEMVPIRLNELPLGRIHEFQRDLINALSVQLKRDPANEIWIVARSLLENPWLRMPEHRRPDLIR